jgi:hypothetical protein
MPKGKPKAKNSNVSLVPVVTNTGTNTEVGKASTQSRPYTREEMRVRVLHEAGLTPAVIRQALETTLDVMASSRMDMARLRAAEHIMELADLRPSRRTETRQTETHVLIAPWLTDLRDVAEGEIVTETRG